MKNRLAWRIGYLAASLGLYLMDQASKAWVVRRLRFRDATVIGGILDFSYAENPGIAFGQLQEGGTFGRWFFVMLAGAAAIARAPPSRRNRGQRGARIEAMRRRGAMSDVRRKGGTRSRGL